MWEMGFRILRIVILWEKAYKQLLTKTNTATFFFSQSFGHKYNFPNYFTDHLQLNQ